MTAAVKEKFSKRNTVLSIIPGGLTKILQPLDISVNRSFKVKLRKIWESWMSDGEHSFTKTGRMRRASYAEVCDWVAEAWNDVKSETIRNGFGKANIIEEEENPVDEPSDNLNDTQLAETLKDLMLSTTEDEAFDGFESDEEI